MIIELIFDIFPVRFKHLILDSFILNDFKLLAIFTEHFNIRLVIDILQRMLLKILVDKLDHNLQILLSFGDV